MRSPPAFALALSLCVAPACTPAPAACPKPSAPLGVVTGGDDASRALLADIAQRATAAGAGAPVIAAEGIVAEGDRVGAFVSIPEGACVIVYARGSKAVADLDLFAFEDDGAPFMTDESASAEAAILACPPHPDRLYVSTRVASGAGRVAIGVQELPPAAAPRVAAAVGARARGDETGRLESWPGLEGKIAEHRRLVGSTWEDVRRFAAQLDPRAPTRTSVSLEAGRCLDVLVAPSEELASVEVVIEDDAGRVVARAQAEGRDRTLVVCSEHGDTVTVAARPRGGAGLAAFVLARSRPGAEGEIAEVVRVESVAPRLDVEPMRAALAKQIDAAWGKAVPSGKGEARVGSRASLDVKLEAGCTRLDVIAGKPLSPVTAALWDDRGVLLSEASGGAGATLYSCSAGAVRARLDVESLGRPGPFVVDARLWKAAPTDLAALPLAAGRLLGRVLGRAENSPAALGTIGRVELAAGKLAVQSALVQPGQCAEMVVATEALEPVGVELRIVDESARDDVIGRGRFVASQRLCANRSARKLRIELRAGTAAKGLLLVRTLSDATDPP